MLGDKRDIIVYSPGDSKHGGGRSAFRFWFDNDLHKWTFIATVLPLFMLIKLYSWICLDALVIVVNISAHWYFFQCGERVEILRRNENTLSHGQWRQIETFAKTNSVKKTPRIELPQDDLTWTKESPAYISRVNTYDLPIFSISGIRSRRSACSLGWGGHFMLDKSSNVKRPPTTSSWGMCN